MGHKKMEALPNIFVQQPFITPPKAKMQAIFKGQGKQQDTANSEDQHQHSDLEDNSKEESFGWGVQEILKKEFNESKDHDEKEKLIEEPWELKLLESSEDPEEIEIHDEGNKE